MSLYLDTSVLVPLHVEEPKSAMLDRWFFGELRTKFISDLAVVEFHSAISRLVRTREIMVDRAAEIIDEFEQWRISVARPLENLPVDIRIAARLVRRPKPKLTPPDAIHLATCQRLGLAIVTHDRAMIEIAEIIGVESVAPGN